MRKSFISMTVSALLCFALSLFAGCSDTPKNVTTITDIEYYSDMHAEADRIKVKFDNNTGKYFKFTIENENDIDYIMNIVLNDKLNNLGNQQPAPANNTSLTVYQDEKAYGVSLNGIAANGNHYAFTSTDLQSKITDLAIAQGAYDTEVGVIYQVIDLYTLKDSEERKITVDDDIALLNFLNTDYADCEYFFLHDSQNSAERYHTAGITESDLALYQYKATVKTGKGKAIAMRHIYQNYQSTSYYITCPSYCEINLGETASSTFTEFAFGLWHNYYLTLWYVS